MSDNSASQALARFRSDLRGSVAILFGFLAAPLVGAAGLGIDYTRAASFKIQLEKAANEAALSAVDTSRALMQADPNSLPETVKEAARERAARVFNARAPRKFSSVFNAAVEVNRVGDTISADAEFTGTIPTLFGNVIGIQTISVTGKARANGSIGPDPTTKDPENPNALFTENFTKNLGRLERGAGNWGYRLDYNNWKTPTGAVEIGVLERVYKVERPPSGSTNAVELDAFRNTSLARKIYLPAGTYDFRYWIRDRVRFTDFDPAWLCGNQQKALVLPATTNYDETNRVELYITHTLPGDDTPPTGLTPETHQMVDACIVTGGRWIERQFTINVKNPGTFWLTFQAKGKSDGLGAFITDIQLCKDKCKDEPRDNYPWPVNTLLFSDSFETSTGSGVWTERTIDNSGTNHGWPRLPTGWTTWPENQLDYTDDWPKDGLLRIGLDATKGEFESNRGISRRFVFTPGYYQLQYWYKSAANMRLFTTLCGADDVSTQTNLLASMNRSRWPSDTNLLRVYMDPDAMFSSPYNEPVLRAVAKWQDPGGGLPTLPRLPSTVLDACVYSQDWAQRIVNFKISKAGFYWLTFRAEGTPDDWGAGLDDFKMYALGGLKTPVANAVAIPFIDEKLQGNVTVGGLEVVSN